MVRSEGLRSSSSARKPGTRFKLVLVLVVAIYLEGDRDSIPAVPY
jgi:hypothetical protein